VDKSELKRIASAIRKHFKTEYTPTGIKVAAGQLAASVCLIEGGNRHDGWIFRAGGKLQQCKPSDPDALVGWNQFWEQYDKMSENA
jgi:hypothetical protein